MSTTIDAGTRADVPVIDIAPFRLGSDTDKERVAKAVDAACESIGFLMVTGHGVDPHLVAKMRAVSREYFALPFWEKMRLKMPEDRYRGYVPPAAESLAGSLDEIAPPDLKESFSTGPFAHVYDEYHFGTDGARFFAPNVWPERPAGFRKIWETYYAEMELLSADLMRIFARALGVPESFFDDKTDRQIANFSAIYYPPQDEAPRERQLRAGAHSDYGSLTIVDTDSDVGGLECRARDGDWVAVPCVPGAFVVNLGDLMADWTNDRWVSTLHRVVNPERESAGADKLSLVFFHQPNYDAVIECIPTCQSAENPAKLDPITSGDHVTRKILKQRGIDAV